jgi:ribosomal-protein-alanine N-acetyltransferase
MIVRSASPADLPAIRSIAEQSPGAPQWPSSAWSAFLNPAIAAPAASAPPLVRICLLAEAEGAILGFAALSGLLDGQENRCELESIAVARGARRQGIASALLREMLRWAESQGVRQLALEVRAGNAAALALYQRFGFRMEARRPGYYRDPEEDALLLAMEVTQVSNRAAFSTGNLIEGGPPRC